MGAMFPSVDPSPVEDAITAASAYLRDGCDFYQAVSRAAHEYGIDWKTIQQGMTARSQVANRARKAQKYREQFTLDL
jgi:hypothetical protein